MTRSIRSEILIDAPPDAIWAVLADFSSHQQWDPFLVAIAGDAAVGKRLTVRFANGLTFRPTVTELRTGRVLEWLGKLLFGGLFDGRHRFELFPEGRATRLVQSESFSGLLVPLLKKTLVETEGRFAALNAALKQRVERSG
jgi:hypothetical protein